MPSLSRRGFIKGTSLSVVAIGAIGAVGPLPALAQTVDAPTMPTIAPGQPFTVYVSDPTSGAGTILVGEQAIPFSNGAIVHALRQAIG
jgi:hypothetical protein